MKLLVDESLQNELGRIFTESGHDAVHVNDLDLQGAADHDVLAAAAATGRVVVTADTDPIRELKRRVSFAISSS